MPRGSGSPSRKHRPEPKRVPVDARPSPLPPKRKPLAVVAMPPDPLDDMGDYRTGIVFLIRGRPLVSS